MDMFCSWFFDQTREAPTMTWFTFAKEFAAVGGLFVSGYLWLLVV